MPAAEKLIRDPVHDVIAFRLDRPEDALLFRLLGAREFQRLRCVRQLGLASLAYPGADHSRYSHCVGVMETARRMLDRLAEQHGMTPEERIACLCGALLHDLGHGPFSHVFERVSGVDHESITARMILDEQGDVFAILATHDPALPRRVVDLLQHRTQPRSFLDDVLSSQLDADRLDYLLRDNLMTGCRYGDYDLRWLLQAMTVDPETRRLAVRWKGVSAVEAYLQSRYHMYRNVYFHKVVRSAEGMLKLVLQRARRLAVQDRLSWPPRDHPVCGLLVGATVSNREFLELDDVSLMHCFKEWSRGDDPILAALCAGLLYRRLFKTIDLSRFHPAEAAARTAAAWRLIAQAGGDPAYDMFFDEVADTPYKTYAPDVDKAGSGIYVSGAPGTAGMVEFSAVSPAATALSRQLVYRRLHVSAEFHDRVASAVEKDPGVADATPGS